MAKPPTSKLVADFLMAIARTMLLPLPGNKLSLMRLLPKEEPIYEAPRSNGGRRKNKRGEVML